MNVMYFDQNPGHDQPRAESRVAFGLLLATTWRTNRSAPWKREDIAINGFKMGPSLIVSEPLST